MAASLPVGVRVIQLGWRSKSFAPNSSSKRYISRVTVGWVTLRAAAVFARVWALVKVTWYSNR